MIGWVWPGGFSASDDDDDEREGLRASPAINNQVWLQKWLMGAAGGNKGLK